MKEALHIVNRETCRGDGICAEICPEDVLIMRDGMAVTIDERADDCILCGQCVAVCPNEAISMPKLPNKDFHELKMPSFGYDEFLGFLHYRRSVRRFRNRRVPDDVRDKILEAAATAPMGFPPHSTKVLIIDTRDEMEYLLKETVKSYAATVKAFSNPIGRLMVRLAAGADDYAMLKDKIVDTAAYANREYTRDGTDRYMYRAPMIMFFHASRRAMSYVESAHLVCHHAMLAAVSLGLGTTILGLVPPVIDRSKALRARYGIPGENKVITSLILGYPKYRYRKGIRRDLAGIRVHGHNAGTV